MKFSLNEQELLHLMGVLKLDLKEKSKDIRRCTFDTNEDIVERRIIAYNRSKDLLQRVEEWHSQEAETNHIPATEFGDDADFRV